MYQSPRYTDLASVNSAWPELSVCFDRVPVIALSEYNDSEIVTPGVQSSTPDEM